MTDTGGRPARAAAEKPPVDLSRRASLALSLLGALVSGYLTWVKLSHTQALCTGVGGCEAVNNSAYSEIRGIPVAALGLGAYLLMALILALESRGPGWEEASRMAVFGLALTGTLYSAYLTYVELFVIFAVCPYCVTSALIITGILILSVLRLARGLPGGAAAD